VQKSTVVQAVFLIVLAVAAVWVASRVADGWADWVVFGVIVMTVIGAARAVFVRRYPTKKRTFVRSSEPGPRPRP
jgi:intracellular septation protein A